MTIAAFDVGDRIRTGNDTGATGSGAFTNTLGVATDPTEVVLRLKPPNAATAVYRWPTPGVGESALSKESTGRFYADVTLDSAGTWGAELSGTGAVESVDSWQLFVRPSLVG
jgi:hypothetical protein